MDIDLLYPDDLPEEARGLVAAADAEVEKIRKKAERESDRVRKKADAEIEAIRQKTEADVEERQRALAAALKPFQDSCAREGLLDEALAIRAKIRALRGAVLNVQPAPEIFECSQEDVGKSFLFDVTGRTRGPLWGTDLYTSDSSLAAAAVHSGVLKAGERGVVRSPSTTRATATASRAAAATG